MKPSHLRTPRTLDQCHFSQGYTTEPVGQRSGVADVALAVALGLPLEAPPTIFEDLIEEGAGMRGRITVYCVAESIDRKALELRLRERGGSFLLHQYPDVLYGLYESSKVGPAAAAA